MIVASIPIKKHSERLENKNFLDFGGCEMFRMVCNAVIACEKIDKIIIDSDSSIVRDYVYEVGGGESYKDRVLFFQRQPEINNASGNELLLHHQHRYQNTVDLWVQAHVTSPFLTTELIDEAVGIMLRHQWFDSLFTAKEVEANFVWQNNAPLYDLSNFSRTQDNFNKMIVETSGLHLVRGKTLKALGRRVGLRPFPLLVNEKEAVDIDTVHDLNAARRML